MLQALSKRIHFGKFIAEAKFQAETERYTKLILANDADGIMEALTNSAVEEVGGRCCCVSVFESELAVTMWIDVSRTRCRKCSSA